MRSELQGAKTNEITPEEVPLIQEYSDPVIEAYKSGVDRTLLRENLKLTVQQRFEKFEKFMEYVQELRQAGRKARVTE